MAYAPTPHIEANFDPVGTGTPYKINWVNSVGLTMIAAGWTPATVLELDGVKGDPYYRTAAPAILKIRQTDLFDSFCLFASPTACDGLAVWSVHTVGASCLCIGWDTACAPGAYDEVSNCCFCDSGTCSSTPRGACDPGVSWGTGAGGTGTDSCGFGCDCSGGCCVADSNCVWEWPADDFEGQHAAIVPQIVEAAAPCVDFDSQILFTNRIEDVSGTTTEMETYVAIWCKGGKCDPLVGATELADVNVGAAFNTEVTKFHGGWVLQTQESNTVQNILTVYIGVNRKNEGPGDIVAATYPFAWSFSTYTASTHPIQYIETQTIGTLTLLPKDKIEVRTLFRNDLNNMRFIANPYQAFMFSYGTNTAGTTTGSQNNLGVGALRQVPLNGEDPTDPGTWGFTKAVFHFGDDAGVGLDEANKVDSNADAFYSTINGGNEQKLATGVTVSADLGVGGFVWTRNLETAPLQWVSGEAFYSEPWTGFNSVSTAGTAPLLGQLWDCIVPSKVGGSGYFFWDGEWWTHWQIYRTDTTTQGGAPANISFRVGFQNLTGPEPELLGDPYNCIGWAELPTPRDVALYNLREGNLSANPLFPWGNITGVSIDGGFTGGTTTRTLTATCTQNAEAPDDGDKLVAVHSNRNYFTFTPEIITIGSGTTTGTSIVTALSPGLGTTTATIYVNSIDQATVSVTVED